MPTLPEEKLPSRSGKGEPDSESRRRSAEDAIGGGAEVRVGKAKSSARTEADMEREPVSEGSGRAVKHARRGDEDVDRPVPPMKGKKRPLEGDEPEDEDERPRSKKPVRKTKEKSARGSSMVLWCLVGGGATAIAAAVAVLMILSSGQPTPEATGGPKLPPRKEEIAKLDVVEARADVVLERTSGVIPQFVLSWNVKYRFVQGPNPSDWYSFEVIVAGGGLAMKRVEGRTLSKEGEVKGGITLSKFNGPLDVPLLIKKGVKGMKGDEEAFPKTVNILIQRGPAAGGPYRPISEKVLAKVATKDYYPFPDKVNSGVIPAKPTLTAKHTVSAEHLIAEMKADPAAAKRKYGTNWIDVTGVVCAAAPHGEEPSAWLAAKADPDVFSRVEFGFDPSKESQVFRLGKGQTARIRGRLAERGTSAVLTGAHVVETGPDPTLVVSAEDFAKEFVSAPKEAKAKYEGKQVEIRGTVVGIEKLGATGYEFHLKGADRPSGKPFVVVAGIPSADSKRVGQRLAAVRVGETVLLRAQVNVFIEGNPTLRFPTFSANR